MYKSKAERLYEKLENILIAKGLITQDQCNLIARRGHRKESYWKRHVRDLCDFVLEVRKVDFETESLLKKSIEWAKR